MKILLDTCTFLWIIKNDSALSNEARLLYTESENEIFFSSVSFWEILVKHNLGRLPLPDSPEKFIVNQRKLHRIESLGLEEAAIVQLDRLPDYHRDPFDRMLVCQAIAHELVILTPDKEISQYPVRCIW